MEEKKKVEPTKIQNQLTAIIVETITRNYNDSKEDFLKKLGTNEELDENNVVMAMTLNALIEITKTLIEIEGVLNQSTGIMTLLLNEEELAELEEKTKESED